MALKRPNRLKYAIYTKEGKEKYAKDMRAYKKGQADAAKKKPVTKKPVTKKPVAKKPVTKKPVTKKPVTKKPVTKKPVTKKPVTKKPVTKKPAPKKTANNLKIKKAANTAVKTTKTAIKKATPVVKKGVKTAIKKAGEAKQAVDKKVSGIKKAFRKKAPKPTTPAQKAVSKVYQGSKKLIKKGVTKGLPKFIDAVKKNPKSAVKGGVASLATAGLTSAINTRVDRAFAKRKGMTLQEFNAAKKKMKDNRNIVRSVKNIAKRLRGNSGESSTTKNINKQKKANTTPNRGLKIKKTERSSRKNTNKDYNAPTATKKADKRFSTFRVDAKENLKLQKERQKGNTETYSRKLSPQAKKQVTDTKTNKKEKPKSKFIKTGKGTLARRGSIAARRAENRERARKRAQEMARRRLANK